MQNEVIRYPASSIVRLLVSSKHLLVSNATWRTVAMKCLAPSTQWIVVQKSVRRSERVTVARAADKLMGSSLATDKLHAQVLCKLLLDVVLAVCGVGSL